MKIRINIDIKVSKLIRHLVIGDFVLLSGWGLISPIFAVFVIEQVKGATLVTAGTAIAIYWILRSVLQLPIARFLDRNDGERDDFYALVIGLLIAAFSAILFAFVYEAWQVYVVQVFHAVGMSLYNASWPAIFSRHLDKDKVSFEWALDNAAVGIATGISGFFGSVLASAFGFSSVFFSAGILSGLSAVILMTAPDFVFPKKTADGVVPPTPRHI